MAEIASIDGRPAYFSDHTLPEVARRLARAGLETDPAARGELLRAALAEHPGALDAHIALYKLCFRTGRHREAERAVWHALGEAARQGGFRRNYRLLGPSSADWLNEQSVSRLYLFSLKALGVVRLRRGRIALAERVLSKVLELDPQDELGAGNFRSIARSMAEEDTPD